MGKELLMNRVGVHFYGVRLRAGIVRAWIGKIVYNRRNVRDRARRRSVPPTYEE